MLFDIIIALAVGLGITLLANLATTVYLHRSLAHRALVLRQPLPAMFRGFLWLSTGIRPRQWVGVHRKHHAFTDEPSDPHSPLRLGWMRVLLTNASLYRRCAKDPMTVDRYAKDLPATRLDRAVLDQALVGLAVGATMLVALMSVVGSFPVWVPLAAGVIHLVGYIGMGGAVNGPGHTFGKRPFDNTGTNLQWLAFLTCGEGLHNNHHAAPTSARFSFRRSEIDPGWMFIRLAKALGLAEIRHDEIKLARTPVSSSA